MVTMKDILYRITPIDLAAHLFAIEIHLTQPDPRGQIISLPAWIPGSYMIRDFARQIQNLNVKQEKKDLYIEKLDSHSWQIQPCDKPIVVSYQVYAWDLSVRTAHLDETHGFYNGTSVFLQIHGQEDKPCLVDIVPPKKHHDWGVYTSLPEAKDIKGAAQRHGFGLYIAPNYDALIDHPVEMGTPTVISFKACGATHEMVFTGNIPNIDLERIARDTQKICEYQIKFFEPETHAAPFLDSSDRYVFMTMVTGKDYGGLEHRASTALVASRADMPVIGDESISEGYRQFLGLISHEYFHTWNVKRIKPKAFTPYDLYDPCHTSLLWIFEGFTSYYDDLSLLRSGVIQQESYLELLSKTITAVHNTPGRFKQSVTQSSFDAWTKYYKQDENAVNSIISYYSKGSLIALGLDLLIQKESAGKSSLDDVMRELWNTYGRDFYCKKPQLGLEEFEVVELIKRATGVDTKEFIDLYVKGTQDVPLAELLPVNAWQLQEEQSHKAELNIKTRTSEGQCQIAQVIEQGAAHLGGLSAGDIFIAIDHIKVDSQNLNALLSRYRVGDKIKVHVFRRDEMRKFKVKLNASETKYKVSPIE